MPGTPWGWREQHSPVSPRAVCSPVRGADVKCRDFQLAVQAPVNAVQGRRVAAGSQERGHTPHQAREQWESCGQQSLIRVPVKAPPSLTPRLSSKSWGWPLLGSASVPQGIAPPTDALAGQRWWGETPHHTLCRGSSQGPTPTVTNCSDCALGRATARNKPRPALLASQNPLTWEKRRKTNSQHEAAFKITLRNGLKIDPNTQFPWQRPHARGPPPGECRHGAGGPRLPGTWPTSGTEGPAPFAAPCLLQRHGGLGPQGLQEHPRKCRPGQALGEAGPACRTAVAPPSPVSPASPPPRPGARPTRWTRPGSVQPRGRRDKAGEVRSHGSNHTPPTKPLPHPAQNGVQTQRVAERALGPRLQDLICSGAKPTLSKGSKALPESTQGISGGFELGREARRLLKGTGFLLGRQMAPKVAQSVNVLHGIVHLNEELIQSKRVSLVAQW